MIGQNQIDHVSLKWRTYLAYRKTPQIYADLLDLTQEDRNGIPITMLCHKANLPYGRLKGFIGHLTSSGLVNKIEYDGKNTFVITPKGRNFLAEYKKFDEIAKSFGLEM